MTGDSIRNSCDLYYYQIVITSNQINVSSDAFWQLFKPVNIAEAQTSKCITQERELLNNILYQSIHNNLENSSKSE